MEAQVWADNADGSEVLQDPERSGDFPIQHPRRAVLAGEDLGGGGLTWDWKAACPGTLFIAYLLFGCHHQRGEEGQQGRGGLALPTCRKTWLRLLWAGSPTKPSRMELASWSLTFFNKTLCTSGPPAAPALFPLAPREEGGTETRPRAGSLRLCPFPAISGHPHWPGCPSHWP